MHHHHHHHHHHHQEGHEHHHHGHHHGHHHHHGDLKNIGVAFFLNLAFTIIEIVGGLLTNSVAILSDALHDFGDSMSLGLAWLMERLSKKGRDQNFSYGYKRFSVLGALITSIILLLGSIVIIYAAILRIQAPAATHGLGMIGFAVLGILVNGAAVFRLKGSDSVNAKAVMLHLMEDVLGWAAVLVGSIIIYFTKWYIIDPIMSLLIALYILFNVIRGLRQIFKIFLQAIPAQINIEEIKEKLCENPDLLDVHDLHVWSLDGQYIIMTMHAVLKNKELSLSEIAPIRQEIEHSLLHFGIEHSTIAFEAEGDDCQLINC